MPGRFIASTLWPCEKSSLRHMRYRPRDSVGEKRLLAARQHHQPIFIGDIQHGRGHVPDLCSRLRFIPLNCHQDGAHHRLEVGYRHGVDSSHWRPLTGDVLPSGRLWSSPGTACSGLFEPPPLPQKDITYRLPAGEAAAANASAILLH
jgi:hypothetical protein